MILAAAFPLPRAPEGRRRTSPALLAGVAISVLIHVAGGAYLYYQRFVLPPMESRPDGPVLVDMVHLTPPPPPREEPTVVRQASPPPIAVHVPTVVTPTTVETIQTPITPPVPLTSDTPPSLSVPIPDAPVASTPTVETPEPQPPATPTVIDSPSWVSRPTAAQLLNAYPRRALGNEVAGSATLRCVVSASGAMASCSVASESPGGYGFGDAAMRLTPYFRINPRTVDGAPVDGAVVRIPLRFGLTG